MFPLVSSVVGPSFEFKDWNEFINLEEPYKSMPKYGNIKPALTRLIQGLLCIGVSPMIEAYFPID